MVSEFGKEQNKEKGYWPGGERREEKNLQYKKFNYVAKN